MKKAFLLLGVVALLVGCKTNDLNVDPEEKGSQYLPMEIGNYWIYEISRLNNNGLYQVENLIDSVVVSRDTTINDETFYFFDRYRKNSISEYRKVSWELLRDSGKCIINEKGLVKFSELNFSDTLSSYIEYLDSGEFLYSLKILMEEVEEFKVLNTTYKDVMYAKGVVEVNPSYNRFENPQIVGDHYSKNVGVIQDADLWILSGTYQYAWLLRFELVDGQ